MFTFKNILLEKIAGNTGWVYHRTKTNPEESDIVTQGIKPSTNQSSMYGRGLYCCYELDQQLKPEMEHYGDYILKGKIDLNGFAILDEEVYRLANPRGDFKKHLIKIRTSAPEVKYSFPFTSKIAKNIWKEYVAIRRQRSGLVKLVGMVGDNRSKLKGINDLVSMNLPLWGMVSKDIKDIAVRKGMREPNFLERQVLKRSIPPEVLGGAEILENQRYGSISINHSAMKTIEFLRKKVFKL